MATNISALQLLAGAGIAGATYIGASYLSKKSQLSSAAKKLLQREEEEAQKAALKLSSTKFFSDLDRLRAEIQGRVILPVDGEEYHACRRRAFNQNQRGFPLCVVRVLSVSDVVACVRFAGKHRSEINLCIACGGHSSKCMMDGSFVIDLKDLKKVSLDLENLTVSVEGGAYLEEVDKALAPHNLGVPVGTYPQTGVGGLVLGAGYGFLARMYGFSVDNFLEAEIVLHTGDVVTANDNNEYSDLIWGLRGGSGNFGIVTKFVFKVHKLPKHCVCGAVAQLTPTLSSAVHSISEFDRLVDDVPDNMAALGVLAGGAPVSPSIWAHFGEEDSVSKIPVLQKATKLGGWVTVSNNIKEQSYHKDLQSMTTPLVMSGHIYHTLVQFGQQGKPLPEEFWQTLVSFTRQKLNHTLVKATLLLFFMGGKMASNDRDGTKTCVSASVRSARYFGIIEAYWKPEFGEEGKNAAREWAKKITEIIKPQSNEALRYAAADDSVNTAGVVEIYKDQAGYGEEAYIKLRALKKKYDPTNFFKNNVNITPAE
eukprot:TRINITY_DN2136_c0_g1_i1.p1 TRINITY_DN2136_c0_g1~~TRINITY_DN2136_c0_g1_i1.p1  ORF type:complete len:560 (-),score=143.44 TRINITY_DN2136_c0_g1_i1:45-1658(-)